MNTIMLAPGYPGETPDFCRGLAMQGSQVYGVSDVPELDLPALTREHMAGYLRVPNYQDEDTVVRLVVAGVGEHRVDRIVCLWEPGVVLAARLREALGVPGQRVEQAIAFRNKDIMKQKVTAAGIRTARHASARSLAQVRYHFSALKSANYSTSSKRASGDQDIRVQGTRKSGLQARTSCSA